VRAKQATSPGKAWAGRGPSSLSPVSSPVRCPSPPPPRSRSPRHVSAGPRHRRCCPRHRAGAGAINAPQYTIDDAVCMPLPARALQCPSLSSAAKFHHVAVCGAPSSSGRRGAVKSESNRTTSPRRPGKSFGQCLFGWVMPWVPGSFETRKVLGSAEALTFHSHSSSLLSKSQIGLVDSLPGRVTIVIPAARAPAV